MDRGVLRCVYKFFFVFLSTYFFLHFQALLSSQPVTQDMLIAKLQAALASPSTVTDLIFAGLTPDQIMDDAKPYIYNIVQWVDEHYMKKRPLKGREMEDVVVEKLLDIEDSVWSPQLGLKGKIDAMFTAQKNGKPIVLPVELKTGKVSFSADHGAQVMLYRLLKNCEDGMLLYLKTGESGFVENNSHAVKALIQTRNSLARYLGSKDPLLLPPPVDNARICSSCPLLLPCAATRRLKQSETNETFALFEAQVLAHVTQPHMDYVEKFLKLLSTELRSMQERAGNRDFWNYDVAELGGKAVGDLRVVLASDHSLKLTSRCVHYVCSCSLDNLFGFVAIHYFIKVV